MEEKEEDERDWEKDLGLYWDKRGYGRPETGASWLGGRRVRKGRRKRRKRRKADKRGRARGSPG